MIVCGRGGCRVEDISTPDQVAAGVVVELLQQGHLTVPIPDTQGGGQAVVHVDIRERPLKFGPAQVVLDQDAAEEIGVAPVLPHPGVRGNPFALGVGVLVPTGGSTSAIKVRDQHTGAGHKVDTAAPVGAALPITDGQEFCDHLAIDQAPTGHCRGAHRRCGTALAQALAVFAAGTAARHPQGALALGGLAGSADVEVFVDGAVAVFVFGVAELGRSRAAFAAGVDQVFVDGAVAVVVDVVALSPFGAGSHPTHTGGPGAVDAGLRAFAARANIAPAVAGGVVGAGTALIGCAIAVFVETCLVADLLGHGATGATGVEHTFVDVAIAVVVDPVADFRLGRTRLAICDELTVLAHHLTSALTRAGAAHRGTCGDPFVTAAIAVVIFVVADLGDGLPRTRAGTKGAILETDLHPGGAAADILAAGAAFIGGAAADPVVHAAVTVVVKVVADFLTGGPGLAGCFVGAVDTAPVDLTSALADATALRNGSCVFVAAAIAVVIDVVAGRISRGRLPSLGIADHAVAAGIADVDPVGATGADAGVAGLPQSGEALVDRAVAVIIQAIAGFSLNARTDIGGALLAAGQNTGGAYARQAAVAARLTLAGERLIAAAVAVVVEAVAGLLPRHARGAGAVGEATFAGDRPFRPADAFAAEDFLRDEFIRIAFAVLVDVAVAVVVALVATVVFRLRLARRTLGYALPIQADLPSVALANAYPAVACRKWLKVFVDVAIAVVVCVIAALRSRSLDLLTHEGSIRQAADEANVADPQVGGGAGRVVDTGGRPLVRAAIGARGLCVGLRLAQVGRRPVFFYAAVGRRGDLGVSNDARVRPALRRVRKVSGAAREAAEKQGPKQGRHEVLHGMSLFLLVFDEGVCMGLRLPGAHPDSVATGNRENIGNTLCFICCLLCV